MKPRVALGLLLAAIVWGPGSAATGVAQQGPGLLRYHVVGWVQWEDQRIELGETWVEGPFGMNLDLDVSFADRSEFELRLFRSDFGGDSVSLRGFITSRQKVGVSSRGLPLWEVDRYRREVAVRRGEVALLTYPFVPDSGETATLNIQIDGPRAELPGVPLPWRLDPRGIRVARVRPGSMHVQPSFLAGSSFLRVTVLGVQGERAAPVSLVASYGVWPLVLPGLSDTILIVPDLPIGAENYSCAAVRAPPRPHRYGGYAPGRLLGRGCFPRSDPWSPIVVRLTSGQSLRLELLGIPTQ